MIITGKYHPFIVKADDSKNLFIEVDEKASLEGLTFEKYLKIPYTVEIRPTQDENNSSKKLFASRFTDRVIFTAYFGYNYDGMVNPKINSYKRSLIKDIEIGHVSSLARLEKRHLEKIKEIGFLSILSGRKIVEYITSDYSRLINALKKDW